MFRESKFSDHSFLPSITIRFSTIILRASGLHRMLFSHLVLHTSATTLRGDGHAMARVCPSPVQKEVLRRFPFYGVISLVFCAAL